MTQSENHPVVIFDELEQISLFPDVMTFPVQIADDAGMGYWPRMRRNSKSIATSLEIVTNIAELAKMNFNLLVKLVHWMDANEKAQRKFRYAVIGSLSRIEATTSLLLVGQMAQTHQQQLYDGDKLDESAKAADEFISKQSFEKGVAVVKYIYMETPPETASHDRRRKWTGWEI